MLIIGDVHGNFDQYKKIIEDHDCSIQLGDFGFKKEHDRFLTEVYTEQNKHRILFGNHDYYPYINKPYSLGDYIYLPDEDIFCIRGAYSIDKNSRTLGIDYFPDEEISYTKFDEIFKVYIEAKPNVVISHDAPHIVRDKFFNIKRYSLTSHILQELLEEHRPSVWIFGHHHTSIKKEIPGYRTKFICLGELETYKI